MASIKDNVAKTKQTKVETIAAANVPLNVQFTGDTFGRLRKYKTDKGLLFEQDVVRLAVANFLEQSGY